MRYPIALETDDGVSFSVIVPDLPGCFSAGDNLDEALAMTAQAIDGHVEILVEDGGEIPLPGAIAAHRANPEYAGMIWAYVEVDLTPYLGKAERVQVTLPAYLLKKIDERVARDPRFGSRSGLLAAGAERVLATLR